jgi:hypothetical protein
MWRLSICAEQAAYVSTSTGSEAIGPFAASLSARRGEHRNRVRRVKGSPMPDQLGWPGHSHRRSQSYCRPRCPTASGPVPEIRVACNAAQACTRSTRRRLIKETMRLAVTRCRKFLQFLEQFRQMNKLCRLNHRQYLPTNDCHFVPQKRVKMSAGFGDDDAL